MRSSINALIAAGWLVMTGCSGRPGEAVTAGPAVTLEQFSADVEKTSGLVLVDFWAPWCGPCRQMKPIFEKVEPDYAGRVRFAKVDVDQGPDVAKKYNITGIPTLILFKDGKPADQRVGGQSESDLRAWLDGQIKAGG